MHPWTWQRRRATIHRFLNTLEILAFKGLVIGFVYSVAMVSGTVWAVQVTLRAGLRSGLKVCAALGVAQLILCGMSLIALHGLSLLPVSLTVWLRLLAIGVFSYMAYKMFTAPKVTSLESAEVDSLKGRLFTATFLLALTMPMRLGGYLAFAVAAGMPLHGLNYITALWVALAAGIGSIGWFIYMVLLAKAFGKRVPERISLRSINKLNPLSGCVFGIVAAVTAIPLAVGT